MSVAWLIAFVVFLVVEGMTASLTSIWFAGGALAALVVQVCGAPLRPQLAVFVIVSFVLFMMVRPFTTRYLSREKRQEIPMWDSFTGRKAVVKKRINNEGRY
ncbi:MAG: NfeD family protein [Enterocloster bolteae]